MGLLTVTEPFELTGLVIWSRVGAVGVWTVGLIEALFCVINSVITDESDHGVGLGRGIGRGRGSNTVASTVFESI